MDRPQNISKKWAVLSACVKVHHRSDNTVCSNGDGKRQDVTIGPRVLSPLAAVESHHGNHSHDWMKMVPRWRPGGGAGISSW